MYNSDLCSIPNLLQSADIEENPYGCISDFRISGQSTIKGNCHNTGTINDIGMKLGTVTKVDKGNKTRSTEFDDDVM